MREIKFRAWNGNEFIYSGSNYDPENTLDLFFCMYGLNNQIEQFTGLLDKNGKEIYEGDIVKVDKNEFIYQIDGKICTIEWMDACLGLRNHIFVPLCRSYSTHIEIIGNIHENKNLLDISPDT